ncbi:MAG: UbiA family prenyltransferase [Clostridium sp.]|jgi:4-hydroxybenzoate polyprenyltransferase|nr:UbiA family prenyltransferase [Clostridium sp.]
MLKRLNIYFKEMYPIVPRLLLGIIIFLEIHFILLLNYGVNTFSIGIGELVGSFTIFSFLFTLRIADDLKDYETDSILFPERALPSGRVKKKDLKIFVTILITITCILNFVFMNNIPFFIILYIYGGLMSVWFFKKHKIQKSLPLALVTHNPVQMIMNIYIISYTCIKYDLYPFTLTSFLVALTLYFPALIWEISRKIRAPKDETEYTTYSKLFGYRKATRFVLLLTLIDVVTNFLLVYRLNRIAVLVLAINATWMTWKFISYMKDPTQYKIVDKVERYTYVLEATMVLVVGIYLLVGYI